MEITRNMLFYWMKKRWPHAINTEVKSPRKARITRPMFWSSAQEMRGHLVIVDPDRMKQIDRFYPDTIFLCVGADDPTLSRSDSEWIMLPDEDRMEKAFNYVSIIIDKFYAWETQLNQASNEFLSYDAIIRSCDTLVEDPISVSDVDFNYVAYQKKMSMERGYEDLYVDESNRLPLEVINLLISLGDLDTLAKKKGVWRYEGGETMLHSNVFYEGQYVGRTSIPYTDDVTRNAYNADILEIVTTEIEQLYTRLGTFFRQPIENAKFRHLISSLVEGEPTSRDSIMRQMEQMGYEEGDAYRLIQIRPQSQETTKRYINVLLAHLETLVPQSICFVASQKCYLLVNESRRDDTAKKKFATDINTFLRESYMIAGCSREFYDIFEIEVAARQTEIAIIYGRNVNPMYWYLEYDSYAFRYSLSQICKNLPASQVASRAISILKKYDNENESSLNETLRIYIELKYNAVEAAQALFISRSTFLRRIDRIKKLTGINLDSYDERLYIGLSYRILDPDVATDLDIE